MCDEGNIYIYIYAFVYILMFKFGCVCICTYTYYNVLQGHARKICILVNTFIYFFLNLNFSLFICSKIYIRNPNEIFNPIKKYIRIIMQKMVRPLMLMWKILRFQTKIFIFYVL